MIALFWLVDRLLSLYMWAVILSAVFSILTSFGVLDTRNRVVWTIGDFLYRITEPALDRSADCCPILACRYQPGDPDPAAAGRANAARRDPVQRGGGHRVLSHFWRPLPDGVAVAVKVHRNRAGRACMAPRREPMASG